jgi:hypothetical protein
MPTTVVQYLRRHIPEAVLRKCLQFLGGRPDNWIHYLEGCPQNITDPCRFAAANGLLDLYEYGLAAGHPAIGGDLAAAGGHLAILERLRPAAAGPPPPICENAAAHGHLDVLIWAVAAGYDMGKACRHAAARGQAAALAWLIQNGAPYSWRTLMADAANAGSIESLEVLYSVWWVAEAESPGVYAWTPTIALAAASAGRRDVLEWLMARGCPTSGAVMDQAALAHPELVKLLRDRGCPWGEDTASRTAGRGDLELFNWLCDQGCPLGEDSIESAAIGGNYELFRRAYARLADPWSGGTEVARLAARHGRLNILRYAVSKGAPVDHHAMDEAATAGQTEIVEYLAEVGCPWDAVTHRMAVVHGHAKLSAWLVEHGCPASEPGAIDDCRRRVQPAAVVMDS